MRNNIKNNIAKDLDLPTLIDMIFILLIFFIVFLLGAGVTHGSRELVPTIKYLPKAMLSDLSSVREKLSTLTFVIERSEDAPGENLRLYVLNPDSLSLGSDSPSIRSALSRVKAMGGAFSARLEDVESVNYLIRSHINAYRRVHFTALEDYGSEIEIIADEQTPFGIIKELFTQCQESRDPTTNEIIYPMIAKVVFHVEAAATREN